MLTFMGSGEGYMEILWAIFATFLKDFNYLEMNVLKKKYIDNPQADRKYS